MQRTSKTGLTASPTKTIPKGDDKLKKDIHLKAIAKPAPFILKPYSGLYNPYPSGCSVLCNHPMEKEAKELFHEAKQNWANDAKRNALLEIEVIKANLRQLDYKEESSKYLVTHVESVPEELFRRYTETDSRPLTPAPTLASAATRASGSRRCVTPDPCIAQPKAQLVLDLRRTHSQETVSYSASLLEPPLIRIQAISARAASLEEISQNYRLTPDHHRKAKTAAVLNPKTHFLAVVQTETSQIADEDAGEKSPNKNDEEEYIKRRGKKKKKKGRDASRGPSAFQTSLDPETQMAAIGIDSTNQSARASLILANTPHEAVDNSKLSRSAKLMQTHKSLDVDSYLPTEILKELRRELNEEITDSELNINKKQALEEALKTISKDRAECEELRNLQNALKLPPLNDELWISLPRNFTRSSARFELPMDSRTLTLMSPMQYLRDHVSISSPRKLLFNCIFNKFKLETDFELQYERKLTGEVLQDALDMLMGRPMTTEEAGQFRNLIGWNELDVIDFRTFCGIAALCERLMAPSFCPRLADRKSDPCHELERADFEILARKLNGQNVDTRLVKILNDIKNL